MDTREIILLIAVVIAVASIFYAMPQVDALYKSGKITRSKTIVLKVLCVVLPVVGLIITLITVRNAKIAV
jgi:hypothetical protein